MAAAAGRRGGGERNGGVVVAVVFEEAVGGEDLKTESLSLGGVRLSEEVPCCCCCDEVWGGSDGVVGQIGLRKGDLQSDTDSPDEEDEDEEWVIAIVRIA